MNWQKHIHSSSEILTGKPVIRGTRLSVDFILGLLAEGWTNDQLFKNYPALNPEIMQAVFSFAAECLREEKFYLLTNKAA